MNAPLLDIRGLDIVFGQGDEARQAASDVSFAVYPGEILCLVGESGSGKSVTALSVLGLLPRQGRVTDGEILFEGTNLLGLRDAALDEVRGAGIAMVFQDIMYSLNPVLTIGRQMCEGMQRHLGMGRVEADARAVQLLERTGLRDAADALRKYPHQLSGGMRQRVMIAMALSCRPRLLIADEPTSALDVTIQLQIMQMLKSIRDETGMAILLITHDIGLVAELADRMVVMYAGQCVEEGPVQALLEHPAHAYTRALMRSIPDIHDSRDRQLASIPGSVPEDYGRMTGCRFAARCPDGADCPFRARDEWVVIDPMRATRCAMYARRAERGEE